MSSTPPFVSTLASLSMYEWPETREALEHLWSLVAKGLRENGINAPERLTRDRDIHSIWNDEKLLVGQTCGWPYVNLLRGKTVPFGRFDYGLPNAPCGHYYSVFIGQTPDDVQYLEDRACFLTAGSIAINGADSQSGFHVFSEILGNKANLVIPDDMKRVTGSHRNSVRHVAEGKARLAAIDAVSFELSKRHDPEVASQVHVLGHSSPVPGLPLITSAANADKTDLLFDAVNHAATALPEGVRQTLMIKGLIAARDKEYNVFE